MCQLEQYLDVHYRCLVDTQYRNQNCAALEKVVVQSICVLQYLQTFLLPMHR